MSYLSLQYETRPTGMALIKHFHECVEKPGKLVTSLPDVIVCQRRPSGSQPAEIVSATLSMEHLAVYSHRFPARFSFSAHPPLKIQGEGFSAKKAFTLFQVVQEAQSSKAQNNCFRHAWTRTSFT
jgi:hypothetical protein